MTGSGDEVYRPVDAGGTRGRLTVNPDVASGGYASQATFLSRPLGGSARPKLLLLHGLGGRSDQLLDYFPDSRLPLIAPDQRAHGADRASAGRDDATFDRLARDQLALLDRLQIPSIAIAGMSMGAGVALTLTTLAPERVDGLLLIRPAWVDEPGPENLAAFRLLGDFLARESRDVLESVQLQRIRTRLMRSPAFQTIAAQSSTGAASLADQLSDPGIGRRRDLLRYLPGSVPRWPLAPPAVPVVVVGALGDPVHPRGMAVTWADRLGGDLVTAPGRDDDPAEYRQAITDAALRFCERVPSLRGFQS